MHEIQEVIAAFSYCSNNRPDTAPSRRLTRTIYCFFERLWSEFNSVRKVIACKICLREQHHSRAGFSSDVDVMFCSSNVVINGLGPVRLYTCDSKSFRTSVHDTNPFYSGAFRQGALTTAGAV